MYDHQTWMGRFHNCTTHPLLVSQFLELNKLRLVWSLRTYSLEMKDDGSRGLDGDISMFETKVFWNFHGLSLGLNLV